MIKAFPKMQNQPQRAAVTDVTLRDFSGGLKTSENETVLKSKYSVVLTNFTTSEEFSHTLRFGTKLFATAASAIIDIKYFASHLIVTLADGRVQKVTSAGVVTTIWSAAIAATLPGAPSGWSASSTHINSTEMNGSLILMNDMDKPIIISQDLTVDYLQDLAASTNINTPIARHCTTVDQYCVCAVTDEPEVQISASGASGTWVGDSAPNDATVFSLGAHAPEKNKRIVALQSFKNKLFVFFVTSIVIVELGIYDADGNHTPKIVDTVSSIGVISHRSIFTNETDIVFNSTDGVFRARRATLSAVYETKPLTDDISPMLYKYLPKIGSNSGYSFVVQDKAKGKAFFFIRTQTDEMLILMLSYTADFRRVSLSIVEGWDFDGGCSTDLKRVFFYKGDKVYQYGNDTFEDEDYTVDYLGDSSVNAGLGNAIAFDWETSWLDANQRLQTKQLINITGDSQGEADFTLDIFTDRRYKDSEGAYDPAASLLLRAGLVGGFGQPSEGFGGGRRFSDERFLGLPARFKLFKFRIHGSATKRLVVSTLSLIYRMGSYKR